MIKSSFNNKLIDSIVRSDNSTYVNNIEEKVQNIMACAIDDLSNHVAYVNKELCILQPMNELLNGGFTDNSKFVYFLGVDSAQLELNTANAKLFWKNIKEKIVYAWKNRKKKKKKKKKKQVEEPSIEYEFNAESYNIFSLCEDLQTAVAKFCAKSSLIYLQDKFIKIIGKEEFGSNTQILIYPVIYDGEVFKYFVSKKDGFIEMDVMERLGRLNHKLEKVGDKLTKIIKIFNVMYYNANKTIPNQLFIESILFSIPDDLFKGNNVYNVFVKIINYLSMSSIKDYPSIINPDKTIFDDRLLNANVLAYKKFIDQFIDLEFEKPKTQESIVSLNENDESNKK